MDILEKATTHLGQVDPKITEITIGGYTFQVGAFLCLCSKRAFIGKLVGVVPVGGDPDYPHWPMIRVQWFYKKSEVNWEEYGLDER